MSEGQPEWTPPDPPAPAPAEPPGYGPPPGPGRYGSDPAGPGRDPRQGPPYLPPNAPPHPWPGGPYQDRAYPWAPAYPGYQWPPAGRLPWAVPPSPGTRYDRLARTQVLRWWRPVLGTLAIVGGFLVVSTGFALVASLISYFAGVPLVMSGNRVFGDPLLDLGFQLALIAIALPLVYGAAWAIQRRPPGTLSSVSGRLRWGWLAWCLPLAFAAVVLGHLAEAATLLLTGEDPGYGWAGWEALFPALIVIVLLVPVQAAAEEYVFRGWIVQAFGSYLRTPWPGFLIGSAAFASLHGYTDWGIVYVFGFGVLMGWLAVRTGGLEAPIALHATNNVLAFGLVAASGQLHNALQQGSLPWQSMVGTIVQLAVYGGAVVIIAQKRAINTLSP